MKQLSLQWLVALTTIMACNPAEPNVRPLLPLQENGAAPTTAVQPVLPPTQTPPPPSSLQPAADTVGSNDDTIADTSTEWNSPTPKPQNARYSYHWLPKGFDAANLLVNRVPPPAGYQRTYCGAGSYADWLRNLPLKAGNPPVMLYNGQPKSRNVHAAVIDIDTGNQDLQQCADAVMRLRAEYLYQAKAWSNISFNFTNGFALSYNKWYNGYRPVTKGSKTNWVKKAKPNGTYPEFKKYLTEAFRYAGSLSLSKQLRAISMEQLQAGDIFIQGGSPGHAVMVLDVAQNPQTNEKIFLLAQSYMPAQDMHLLNNPNNNALSPWYSLNFGKTLYTPEWTFSKNDLKRF